LNSEKIKILIADDHLLIREALKNALDKEADFEVVAEVSDGAQAVELANKLRPNVVIMDITLPGMDGLEATRQIKATNPDINVLALTIHDDEEFMLNMLEAGADGYLTKTVSSSEILSAMRILISGEMVLSPVILRKIIRYSHQRLSNRSFNLKCGEKLTIRELGILQLVAQGATNKEIAQDLNLSIQTVKGHLVTILGKLNARSRTEAIIIGLREGILNIENIT
jgi:DNA-binding NarL/FixJ family response regulator